MLLYGTYIGILLPLYMVIPLVFLVTLAIISKKRLTEIIKIVLAIEKDPQANPDTISIDFHGTKMKMKESADRSKLITTLFLIFAIVHILFINGCVISIEYLTPGQKCPDKPKDCFIFESRTSITPNQSFVCDPGEVAIPVNSSVFCAVCYRYILGDQKAVDILNQLGICSGVISLSANILWLLCWIVSHERGRLIFGLIFTGTSIITALTFIRGPLEVVTPVLFFLWSALVVMTFWIVLGNKEEEESIQTEVSQRTQIITHRRQVIRIWSDENV
jgi:hypothetical protein